MAVAGTPREFGKAVRCLLLMLLQMPTEAPSVAEPQVLLLPAVREGSTATGTQALLLPAAVKPGMALALLVLLMLTLLVEG